MTKLTAKFLEGLDQPGKVVYDEITTGLAFRSTGRGKGSWSFRYMLAGKRREKSLGGWPKVSLPRAREAAQDLAKLVRAGIDPVEAKREAERTAAEAANALTFEKAARQVHADLKPGFKNAKHTAQWISTLEAYVFPTLGAKALETITPKDCADALRSIWLEKPETASRTRQRMQSVMQWAWAHGHVAANPVVVVDHLLPKQSAKVEHQPAMPWRDVPTFVKAQMIDLPPGDSARAALLLLILTATRSGEVRGATWDEFDLAMQVWTIPAERMKMREPHRVPLSTQAIALLKALKTTGQHETLVFPSPRKKILSDMTLTALLRRTKAKSDTLERVATAHGFRSSFRDWASEHGYARDLAERALAHAVANAVEAAYHRTDLLEGRRPLMQSWADHVFSKVPGEQHVADALSATRERTHTPSLPVAEMEMS